MDIANLIQTIAVYALPVLLAITVHEAAHGYAAKRLGDNTAWALGRVTLNPLKHIDPVGTVLMPLVLFIATSGAFVFGFAKPVPVYASRLRNPRRDMMWVALAGPAVNFVMAVLWALLGLMLAAAGSSEAFLSGMVRAGVIVNLVMFAFNLFPLPPLDGGRILVGLLPPTAAHWVARVEPYGIFIVMALVVTNVVSTVWMRPVMDLASMAMQLLLSPVRTLLGT